VRIKGIVGVDQRRPEVAMTETFLNGAKRSSGRGHLRSIRVPQVVKPNRSHARSAGSGLEPFPQPRRVKHIPIRRMREDELIVGCVRRMQVVLFELGPETCRDRDGAA
jgi:hypothetical protein